MTTPLVAPVTVVTVADTTVGVNQGSTVTLDETSTYATARLTIPLIDLAAVEEIDPRDGVRAMIVTGAAGETPREFDLGVRSRTVNHANRTINLDCASDEKLVEDYAPLVPDLTPLQHTGSVRAFVNYVLGVVLPGASLEADPDDDAPATMLDVDNLVENPKVEFDTAGWNAWMNGATGGGARTAGTNPEGDWFYRVSYTSSAGDESGPFYTIDSGIKVGTRYTASVWMRSNVAKDVRLRFEWKDSAGTPFAAVVGPTVSLPANTWRRVLIEEMEAPAFAAKATVTMYDAPGGTNWVSGNQLDVVGLRVGPTVSEPLYWPAGVNAWDFMLNVTSAAQLRLFCDEHRAWRLVSQGYTVPGVVSATPANSRDGTDSIERDGDLWADGVIVKYTWTEADGTSREMLDVAGVPGKVQIIEMRRPYPGPGAAAFRLNRLKGQGRTQEGVAIADYTATPGMEARYSLPGTLDQVGRLQAVTFGLTDGFMGIRARGLTDVPETAYIFGDPGISYADVPVGMSYAEFDWGSF